MFDPEPQSNEEIASTITAAREGDSVRIYPEPRDTGTLTIVAGIITDVTHDAPDHELRFELPGDDGTVTVRYERQVVDGETVEPDPIVDIPTHGTDPIHRIEKYDAP